MRRLEISSEDEARFVQLAALYAACGAAYENLAADTDWRAAERSAAAADRRAADERVGTTGARDVITSTVHWYIYGASRYLSGLSALFAANEVLFTTAPLIRSALEMCAHAVWVLGDLDHDRPDDRLARAYLEKILSAEEAKKTSARLLGKTADEARHRGLAYANVKGDIERLFSPPHADRNGRPLLQGHTMPRPQACVSLLLQSPNLGLDRPSADGVYDFYSNRCHPTLYQLTSLWTTVHYHDGPEREPVLRESAADHDKDARLVVLSFYAALSRVMRYHGWPGDRQAELTAVIDQVLPGALAP